MYYLCSKNVYFMKRIILTLLVLLSFSAVVKAGPFSFGVVAGMNITKGDATGNVYGWNPDTEHGWFAGLQLKCTSMVGFGFDASLLYSQENITVPGEYPIGIPNPVPREETSKVGYVAIPVHLRYDLLIPGVNWIATPFIFTGPQAAVTVKNVDESYRQTISAKDFVWRYDLGGGVLVFKHLQAAYSYSFPLSKTYEGSFNNKKDQFIEDYKSGVHRISLTYFF